MTNVSNQNEIINIIKKLNSDADHYRLGYHLTPRVGLLNDPNGLIYFNGEYHVFYQWNPFETKHTYKCWGHYSTKDLIHWTEHPPALLPEDWFDKNGCYSGSAIEHNGKLILFYTGNVKNEAGERETYQCTAISEDGIHFEKQGPVVHLPKGYTAHFRDPKVWKEQDKWFMVLGAQTEDEEGCAVLYTSVDLKKWEFHGPIAGNGINGIEKFGYMWECPDFFELENQHILLVSPQGLESRGMEYQNLFQSGYFIGEWNKSSYNYTHRQFTEIDRGFDFYAPQTFQDKNGRRIMYAWMGMGDENEQNHPSIESGNWLHGLTIPRQLQLKAGRIFQKPLEELQALRTSDKTEGKFRITDESAKITLPSMQQELQIEIREDQMNNFTFEFGKTFKLSFKNNVFSLERTDFTGTRKETRECRLSEIAKLHIFLDNSSLEVFLNDGIEVFTARIYPQKNENTITISVKGTAYIDWNRWSLREFTYKSNF